jgi:hypothetical protein
MRHIEATSKTTRAKLWSYGDRHACSVRMPECETLRQTLRSGECVQRNAEKTGARPDAANVNSLDFCSQHTASTAYNHQSLAGRLDVRSFVTTIVRSRARVSKKLFRVVGRFTGASSATGNALVIKLLNAGSNRTANKTLAEQTSFAYLRHALHPRNLILIRKNQRLFSGIGLPHWFAQKRPQHDSELLLLKHKFWHANLRTSNLSAPEMARRLVAAESR